MSADGVVRPDDITCPFCCEAIRPAATVCRHCRRDLSIPMPLLMTQREQRDEIVRLRTELAELRALMATHGTVRPAELPRRAEWAAPRWTMAAAGWLAALLLLLAAHWLLVIRHDAALVVLRAACIVIPATVAAVTPDLWRLSAGRLAALGLPLGLVAVTAMSWVVSIHDGTPVLPATGRDLYEMAEFAASIGLSFLAGGLAMGLFRRRLARAGTAPGMRLPDIAGIEARTSQISKVTENATLIATTASALAAGFRSLLP